MRTVNQKPGLLFGIVFIFLCATVTATPVNDPISFQNGVSLEHFSTGMYAPTEMDFDHNGNLFVASGYEPTWPIGGAPTPIFKVTPDGTATPYSTPISDPDALSVDSAGNVYVGSYGGKITKIDAVTEIASLWHQNSVLKNIDGLRFSPSGDLYAVAIDSSKVHKIDMATKNVVEVANLWSLGITGMSGIAFHPVTNDIYVESPLENKIIKLDPAGVNHQVIASGFQFLGFIDFDPTGKNNDYIYGPDALSGQVFKINIHTGNKILLVDKIDPGPVGLVFDSTGVLYFNMNYDQVQNGEVYRLWDMTTTVTPSNPLLGDPLAVDFDSQYDEFALYGAFLGLDNNGPYLPDGRRFPISLVNYILISNSQLDGNGHAGLNFTIPTDPSFSGLKVYFAFATYNPVPFYFVAMSNAAEMIIQ